MLSESINSFWSCAALINNGLSAGNGGGQAIVGHVEGGGGHHFEIELHIGNSAKRGLQTDIEALAWQIEHLVGIEELIILVVKDSVVGVGEGEHIVECRV